MYMKYDYLVSSPVGGPPLKRNVEGGVSETAIWDMFLVPRRFCWGRHLELIGFPPVIPWWLAYEAD